METYIYIFAAGHSGSTLLDLLLGSHSRIESLGEITHLPKNIALNTTCTCGAPVRSCLVWNKVLQTIGNKMGIDLFADPYALNLGFINAKDVIDRKNQTPLYIVKRKVIKGIAYSDLAYGLAYFEKLDNFIDKGVHNNLQLYDTVIKMQDVNCIVDSSKDYLKGIKLYRLSPKKTKLILLTRNGLGVFYSTIKRGYPKRQSLLGWRNYYTRTLRLVDKYVPASDIFYLKYEELATQTETVLKRICNFVGIEFEQAMLNFTNHPHHITNGNNMRFQESSEIRLDEKWRSGLQKAEYELFTKICGSVNQKLGYEP